MLLNCPSQAAPLSLRESMMMDYCNNCSKKLSIGKHLVLWWANDGLLELDPAAEP